MGFTYIDMERAFNGGYSLGAWNSNKVYVLNKKIWLEKRSRGDLADDVIYAIYDDGNALIKGVEMLGNLTKSGDILELREPRIYLKEELEKMNSKNKVRRRPSPVEAGIVSDTNELVLNFNIDEQIFDSITKDIDNMLKNVSI